MKKKFLQASCFFVIVLLFGSLIPMDFVSAIESDDSYFNILKGSAEHEIFDYFDYFVNNGETLKITGNPGKSAILYFNSQEDFSAEFEFLSSAGYVYLYTSEIEDYYLLKYSEVKSIYFLESGIRLEGNGEIYIRKDDADLFYANSEKSFVDEGLDIRITAGEEISGNPFFTVYTDEEGAKNNFEFQIYNELIDYRKNGVVIMRGRLKFENDKYSYEGVRYSQMFRYLEEFPNEVTETNFDKCIKKLEGFNSCDVNPGYEEKVRIGLWNKKLLQDDHSDYFNQGFQTDKLYLGEFIDKEKVVDLLGIYNGEIFGEESFKFDVFLVKNSSEDYYYNLEKQNEEDSMDYINKNEGSFIYFDSNAFSLKLTDQTVKWDSIEVSKKIMVDLESGSEEGISYLDMKKGMIIGSYGGFNPSHRYDIIDGSIYDLEGNKICDSIRPYDCYEDFPGFDAFNYYYYSDKGEIAGFKDYDYEPGRYPVAYSEGYYYLVFPDKGIIFDEFGTSTEKYDVIPSLLLLKVNEETLEVEDYNIIEEDNLFSRYGSFCELNDPGSIFSKYRNSIYGSSEGGFEFYTTYEYCHPEHEDYELFKYSIKGGDRIKKPVKCTFDTSLNVNCQPIEVGLDNEYVSSWATGFETYDAFKYEDGQIYRKSFPGDDVWSVYERGSDNGYSQFSANSEVKGYKQINDYTDSKKLIFGQNSKEIDFKDSFFGDTTKSGNNLNLWISSDGLNHVNLILFDEEKNKAYGLYSEEDSRMNVENGKIMVGSENLLGTSVTAIDKNNYLFSVNLEKNRYYDPDSLYLISLRYDSENDKYFMENYLNENGGIFPYDIAGFFGEWGVTYFRDNDEAVTVDIEEDRFPDPNRIRLSIINEKRNAEAAFSINPSNGMALMQIEEPRNIEEDSEYVETEFIDSNKFITDLDIFQGLGNFNFDPLILKLFSLQNARGKFSERWFMEGDIVLYYPEKKFGPAYSSFVPGSDEANKHFITQGEVSISVYEDSSLSGDILPDGSVEMSDSFDEDSFTYGDVSRATNIEDLRRIYEIGFNGDDSVHAASFVEHFHDKDDSVYLQYPNIESNRVVDYLAGTPEKYQILEISKGVMRLDKADSNGHFDGEFDEVSDPVLTDDSQLILVQRPKLNPYSEYYLEGITEDLLDNYHYGEYVMQKYASNLLDEWRETVLDEVGYEFEEGLEYVFTKNGVIKEDDNAYLYEKISFAEVLKRYRDSSKGLLFNLKSLKGDIINRVSISKIVSYNEDSALFLDGDKKIVRILDIYEDNGIKIKIDEDGDGVFDEILDEDKQRLLETIRSESSEDVFLEDECFKVSDREHDLIRDFLALNVKILYDVDFDFNSEILENGFLGISGEYDLLNEADEKYDKSEFEKRLSFSSPIYRYLKMRSYPKDFLKKAAEMLAFYYKKNDRGPDLIKAYSELLYLGDVRKDLVDQIEYDISMGALGYAKSGASVEFTQVMDDLEINDVSIVTFFNERSINEAFKDLKDPSLFEASWAGIKTSFKHGFSLYHPVKVFRDTAGFDDVEKKAYNELYYKSSDYFQSLHHLIVEGYADNLKEARDLIENGMIHTYGSDISDKIYVLPKGQKVSSDLGSGNSEGVIVKYFEVYMPSTVLELYLIKYPEGYYIGKYPLIDVRYSSVFDKTEYSVSNNIYSGGDIIHKISEKGAEKLLKDGEFFVSDSEKDFLDKFSIEDFYSEYENYLSDVDFKLLIDSEELEKISEKINRRIGNMENNQGQSYSEYSKKLSNHVGDMINLISFFDSIDNNNMYVDRTAENPAIVYGINTLRSLESQHLRWEEKNKYQMALNYAGEKGRYADTHDNHVFAGIILKEMIDSGISDKEAWLRDIIGDKYRYHTGEYEGFWNKLIWAFTGPYKGKMFMELINPVSWVGYGLIAKGMSMVLRVVGAYLSKVHVLNVVIKSGKNVFSIPAKISRPLVDFISKRYGGKTLIWIGNGMVKTVLEETSEELAGYYWWPLEFIVMGGTGLFTGLKVGTPFSNLIGNLNILKAEKNLELISILDGGKIRSKPARVFRHNGAKLGSNFAELISEIVDSGDYNVRALEKGNLDAVEISDVNGKNPIILVKNSEFPILKDKLGVVLERDLRLVDANNIADFDMDVASILNSKWPNSDELKNVADPNQCFLADTKILMSDGSEKNIQDVDVGDEVVAYDAEKGNREIAEVVSNFKRKTDSYLEVEYEVIE